MKNANIKFIAQVVGAFLFMVSIIVAVGVDSTRRYNLEVMRLQAEADSLQSIKPQPVYIAGVYLYSPFIDTLNPFHRLSYDTVTVIDTCRGYVLFNGGWLGEQSSTIGHFAAHSKLYKINGGYLP